MKFDKKLDTSVVEYADGVDVRTHTGRAERIENRNLDDVVSKPSGLIQTRISETKGGHDSVPLERSPTAEGHPHSPTENACKEEQSVVRHETTVPDVAGIDLQLEKNFVDHLFGTAKDEIVRRNFPLAQQYIDRLKSPDLDGTEELIAELEDLIGFKKSKAARGLDLLNSQSLDFVIKYALDLENDEEPRQYLERLQSGIIDSCYARVRWQLSKYHFRDVSSTIDKMAHAKRLFHIKDPKVWEEFAAEVELALRRLSFNAFEKEYFQYTVDILQSIHAAGDILVARKTIMAVCEVYFGNVQKSMLEEMEKIMDMAPPDSRSQSLTRNDLVEPGRFLREIRCTDQMLEIAISLVSPGPTRKPIMQLRSKKYEAKDEVMTKTIKIRSNTLQVCEVYVKKYIQLTIQRETWENAWKAISHLGDVDEDLYELQNLWDRCEASMENFKVETKSKTIETDLNVRLYNKKVVREWIILISHIASRRRHWYWFNAVDISESQVQKLDTEYQYLYYLSQAELAYFKERQVDRAISFGKKAIRFNGAKQWGCPQSDVLFLLARALTRKELHLDAKYYSSLIEADYNEWRIYGEPGRALKDRGLQLSKGELKAGQEDENEKFTILIRSTLDDDDDDERSQNEFITQGLFADDIRWNSIRLRYMSVYVKSTLNYHYITTRDCHALQMYAACGKRNLVEIALNNPWVDVNQKDSHGKTALHYSQWYPSVAITTLLLQHGARADIADAYGVTPLHELFKARVKYPNMNSQFTEILQLFLDTKPEISAVDWEGATVLHTLMGLFRNRVDAASKRLGGEAKLSIYLKYYPEPELTILEKSFRMLFSYIQTSGQRFDFLMRDKNGRVGFDEKIYKEAGFNISKLEGYQSQEEDGRLVSKVIEAPQLTEPAHQPKERKRLSKIFNFRKFT